MSRYPCRQRRPDFHRRAPREEIHFEGSARPSRLALPGRPDPINDAEAPPPGEVGPDGIGNGLYSIHIRMLDGLDAGNTGVMLLQDGRIRGGDAFFDYIGAYHRRTAGGKARSSTASIRRAKGERPLFGGHEVGIGFSGTYDSEGRKAKPPRSPASAVSASRRCCESWWMWRVKPSRSPASARR